MNFGGFIPLNQMDSIGKKSFGLKSYKNPLGILCTKEAINKLDYLAFYFEHALL